MPKASRRGFTLIEVMISTLLLATVMSAVVMMSKRNHDAYRQNTQQARIEQALQRGLMRAAVELRDSTATTLPAALAGNFGSSDFLFESAPDVNGGNLTFTSFGRLAFEYDNAEADDGVDNDGDGLIDEGLLVLWRDAGAGGANRRLVLAKNVAELLDGEAPNAADDNGNGLVDEPGFVASVVGDVVTLRLTIEESTPGGGTISRSAESSVRLRNTL